MASGAAILIAALAEAGIDCLFANLGSDHPPLIEALAAARTRGLPAPRIVTCPNEMVALSAAHGHALVSGRAQAVLVHVECGTQALAGAVHNAARGRAPVLILAGASPFTQEGELPGSRNEFIQWIQDVGDQRGLVRGYMRYDNELRSARNIRALVHRALQFAESDPQGPTYLMAAREVLAEEAPEATPHPAAWPRIAPAALAPADAAAIAQALAAARRPLVVTSYLGRSAAGFAALADLARAVGIGVLDSVPSAVNFPATDPLYLGQQWNEPRQNPVLAEADCVLVLESDVPWIPLHNRPAETATVLQIDRDPLKQAMPLFQLPASRIFRADAATALAQIAAAFAALPADPAAVAARAAHWAGHHRARAARLQVEAAPGAAVTVAHLMACLRDRLGPRDIVLNEAISHYATVFDHLAASRPGAVLASGGGSLGWNGGAAIGAKLAMPDAGVIAVSGDGSYMFSVPASVHWMARRYATPFLQIVLNNRGWKSPRLSLLAQYPQGAAAAEADIGVRFDPPADYGGIAAAAGGAASFTLTDGAQTMAVLDAALRVVREEGRAAVLDVRLAALDEG
ncbi:MAG: thiamine pyrophosphate-requiring protein [Rhodospirillales bacterium]|nr:thiamine pyrophosphate-requiring protein [Rhodospirillales bacterium]